MNIPSTEFFILNDVQIVNDKALIEGRCYHGIIHIGNYFNQLCRVWCERGPEGFGPEKREIIAELDLKVIKIWAYGHELSELHEGMSARLEVSGVGIQKLQKDFSIALIK